MNAPLHSPPAMPSTRMLGRPDRSRRMLLGCVDVVVGYVAALHRTQLDGWRMEAALVETRQGFRGGETVALRIAPVGGGDPRMLAPVPMDVLREVASRIVASVDGVAHVVPDIASAAPDVDGAGIDFGPDGVHVTGLDIDRLVDELRSA